eukprot:CAMPEP_0198365364 /NCGR_PEP_ID=MMETSP1450-20131203/154137_1 /TAXON_ID=753684 ORGANISM="Madagascaria erythrocladiodes, Strain CCMP3234" /NCGR_SAMPLE_ID=MMETSP1450 /ASSEMBLY_ACC=CAM_ASM_001115 /LENGTH=182 /DNA_ID=CAMNT_0044072815 /DNA_START=79 /DNA_END=627 /DNA_ORIENTATION=+
MGRQFFPPYGKPSQCAPTPITEAPEGMVSWAWFPEFKLLTALYILSYVVMVTGLLVIIFGRGSWAGIVLGLIFILGGIVMFWIFGNWKWNADKQSAIMVARGKRVQALDLWQQCEPMFSYQAKDTFFSTRYGGKTLVVLRDGTIEVHGGHADVSVNNTSVALKSVDNVVAVENMAADTRVPL